MGLRKLVNATSWKHCQLTQDIKDLLLTAHDLKGGVKVMSTL